MRQNREKIIKKAFSIAELIIVSSILILTSLSGVFYFNSYIEELSFKKSINKIKTKFNSLDNKINKKEIFDYEIVFKKNEPYYISWENIFNLETKIKIKEIKNDEISLKFDSTKNWIWKIRLYENDKLKQTKIISQTWIFTWSLKQNNSYKIKSSFSWETLNSINLDYFGDKKPIKLIKIETKTDKDLEKIKAINILWKKEFWENKLNDKLTLTFENESWVTQKLEIKK